MAIDVTKLPAYTEEHRLPLLRNAVVGNRTAQEFNLYTGLKGKTALNLLNTTVTFGDGSSCGWNEAGKSEMSQRTIEPGYIKVNMSFCDKALLKTWANYSVRIAAGQKTLPFEEDFMAGVIDGIKANLEKAMWQGDTTSGDANLNKFNGMIKILTDASVAGTYTVQDSDSVSTIINKTYALIPSAAYEKGEVVMFVGYDTYRAYIQELIANGNLVITNVVQDVAMPTSVLIPGSNVRVIPVGGLDNQKVKAVASYRDNFIYGVDLTGDEEKLDMWYSQDNREFRLAVEFLAGVQVAYPDMVSVAKKA